MMCLQRHRWILGGWLGVLILGAFSVSASVTIENGLNHEQVVTPGESYDGVIFVHNNSDEPTVVKSYKTDYLFFSNGVSEYGDSDSTPRSNGGWLSVRPARLTIEPHTTSAVHFTVEVPGEADLLGSYWSMVMVEVVPRDSAELAPPAADEAALISMQVKTVTRYGIQVVSHIGETGKVEVAFPETQLETVGDQRFLHVAMENLGERMVRARLWAELYDQEGQQVGVYEASRLRTYPGTSVRYSLDVSPVPPGAYKCLIVAERMTGDLVAAELDLAVE